MSTKNIFMITGVIAIAAAASYGLYRLTGGGSLRADRETAERSTASVADSNGLHRIALKTNYGAIQFETYDADAPKTVENFLKLAREGFYDDLTFHRVVKGFVIQGGDPNCSPSASSTGPCGAGGPGYAFEDELNPETASYKAGYKKGVVAMANAGPDTNGSQFFIVLEDYPLPHNYTIFGKVVKGQEIVDTIGRLSVDSNDKPLSPVVIEQVTVE
ncbi:MAG: peptidylprolyl isomerase [Candidatus Niyogibacteria bacterium]|nr:peptidylprolyl isomerase [Candidatus Niyogibacteria bacterium]